MIFKRLLIICLVSLLALPLCAQASFTTDADAIEKAADSVLLLYIYEGDEIIGTGSGFVAFDNQTLVTNHHVLEPAQSMIASDDDGNLYLIDKVLCVSETMDIAIVGFASPTNLKPLDIATGDDLKRGEAVVAIGSPQGLKNTVSTGVVSALVMDGTVPKIQISAPISHGSSGGALFNDRGHVVGVTSGGIETGQNLNFAVRGSVPLALYAAWDGKTYPIDRFPSETAMNFTAGEKLAVREELAAASIGVNQTGASWVCTQCSQNNNQNFCLNCGAPKPQWQCVCGQVNLSRFCGSCGKKTENLLADFGAALMLMADKEFEKAADALEKLGKFDGGGIITDGREITSASKQLQACYYQWALQLEGEKEYTKAYDKYIAAGTYADAPQKIYEMAYLDASQAFEKGEYTYAAELFMILADYRDSETMAMESAYKLAESMIYEDREDEAIEGFKLLEDYKEAATFIKEAYCHKGGRMADAGEFGEAILAYEAAGDYEPAKEGLKRTHYLSAEALLAIEDYTEAAKAFELAGDYADAAERCKAAYYQQGEMYAASQAWDEAKTAFQSAGNYRDAEDRIKAINYSQGEAFFACNEWDKAKEAFAAAGDYQDASEKLQQVVFAQGMEAMNKGNWLVAINICREEAQNAAMIMGVMTESYQKQLNYYITIDAIKQACEHYQQGIADGCTLEEPLIAAPGLSDSHVAKVLTMAYDMGFIKKLDKNEDTYDEKYADGIRAMETALGLTADGQVSLTEYFRLQEMVYPTVSGAKVKDLLEKLCDLGYIDKLADDHSTYTSKLKKSVQKAEKALGLTEDGVLTPEEQTSILNQPVDPPAKVTNFKNKVSKNEVTLSWSKSAGAKSYTIYRDGIKIATTTSTKYKDKVIKTGTTYRYEIRANRYTTQSNAAATTVWVKPVYLSVSVAKVRSYADQSAYLKLTSLRKEKQMWDGKDLVVLVYKKVDGITHRMYVRFANHDSWSWNGGGIANKKNLKFDLEGKTQGYKKHSLYSSSLPEIDASQVWWYE